ncbi:MAG: GTP-binding protein [Muribaculaceae bacterium]|nr:GTP-binding protein [Muribaculaceae bacterium]
MEKKTVPVLLITGYLGSGKTTLLNKILNNRKGIRFAVIVNDIGEVNIDADLIAKDGLIGQGDDSLVALQNGCICCTLQMDLVNQLVGLMEGDRFDYIVIEASGICEPEPIAQTICSIPAMGPVATRNGIPVLDCIVTVVDALRLQSEFGSGKSLTVKEYGEEDLENLVVQQIEFCNIVLLNKISEVSREDASMIREAIHALNPSVEIIECNYCDVDFSRLLDTHKFDFGKAATSATWIREIEKPLEEIEVQESATKSHEPNEHHHEHEHHHDHEHHHNHEHHHEHEHHEHEHEDDHEECRCEEEGHECHHHHHHHGEGEAEEYGISTFVYYRRQPFDLNKFDYFCHKQWPKSVIRCKGICYFSENPDMSYLFEQAGVQKKLTECGQWYATAPEEELQRFFATEPGLLRDWDDKYGDRMDKLVFIGRGMDRSAITALLDSCLSK